MPTIDILLATYNGARFLPEQLRSLEEQTFTDWRLIVRDDGSSDGSLAIVEQWASRNSVPLRILDDGRKTLGARDNFGALLEASDAPYFAFCDQDDVWLPKKLELMLERVRTAEERHGSDTPVLAYSDLRLVDAGLNEIHRSFRDFSALHNPGRETLLRNLMMQCILLGCASLGNATLRQTALPVPQEAIMHDWWFALVAAATGELLDVPKVTVLYRQHGRNASDPVKWTLGSLIRRFLSSPLANLKRARSFVAETQRQAFTFHARFGERLNGQVAEVMRRYGALHERTILQRKKFLITNKLWSRRFLRNIILFIAI